MCIRDRYYGGVGIFAHVLAESEQHLGNWYRGGIGDVYKRQGTCGRVLFSPGAIGKLSMRPTASIRDGKSRRTIFTGSGCSTRTGKGSAVNSGPGSRGCTRTEDEMCIRDKLYPHDVVRAMAAGVIASLVYFLVSKVSDDLGA